MAAYPASGLADRVYFLVACAAQQPDVRDAVEANHDDNRWWPLSVSDWRVRMAVAGWSTRVSYAMISTYADVVARADTLGWSGLTRLDDMKLGTMVRPLGLTAARVGYLRSLAAFISRAEAAGTDLAGMRTGDLVSLFAASVRGAGYKVAQCAALYARGYHCGIIPVDSGMITRLAPFLGVRLSSGPAAHEQLRRLLEQSTVAMADRYRDLASGLRYRVHIPDDADPTWFTHLVLIYFKRLYLNRPGPRVCPRRPACPAFLDCGCVIQLGRAAVEVLGVIGNISRDRAIYPGGRRVELLGGAALHVALAATRAGLPSIPVAVIGSDLGWIRDDARLTDIDLSCVEVTCGRSCSFRLAYDESGHLTGTASSFGVAAHLTQHVLEVLGRHRNYHVCCRRPLDVPVVLGRLVSAGIPFSVDFHLASAAVVMPTADAAIAHASVVFVNAAEFATLSEITDPRRLKAVVISDGSRPVVMLRSGRVVASVLPPDASVIEVTGAGDTLAGTFLAARARGLGDQPALEAAVGAAAEAVAGPGLVIPA
jgi:sugar/nucleoside kinase (ribokinase family)